MRATLESQKRKWVREILRSLLGSAQSITAAVLLSGEAEALEWEPEGPEPTDLAQVAGGMAVVAETGANSLARGSFRQVCVRMDKGYLVITRVSAAHTLAVVTSEHVALGGLLLEVNGAAGRLQALFQ